MSFDTKLIAGFEMASDVISGIRTIRKEKNISFRDAIELKVIDNENTSKDFDAVILKLGNVLSVDYILEKPSGALSFRVRSNEYFIPVAGAVNVDEEISKLTEELNYTKGFLKSVRIKLSNEKFVSGAPEKVLEMERKKEADALAKIEMIESSMASLK